jgi:hypothetical protein
MDSVFIIILIVVAVIVGIAVIVYIVYKASKKDENDPSSESDEQPGTQIQDADRSRSSSSSNTDKVAPVEYIIGLSERNDPVCKETGECPVCYEQKTDLYFCRNGNCRYGICQTCIDGVYGSSRLGELFAMPKCPHCRLEPTADVLSRIQYKPSIIGLHVPNVTNQYLAWCKTCGQLRGYGEVKCDKPAPKLNNWTCDSCEVGN